MHKVSVMMPAYNAELFIAEVIDLATNKLLFITHQNPKKSKALQGYSS